jgi:amino acid permease
MLPGKLGVCMQIFSNITLWVAMLLSLISYLIVIHDSGRPFLLGTVLEQRSPLAALAACVVLPICFLSPSYLSMTSIIACVANVYIIALFLVRMIDDGAQGSLPEGVCYMGFAAGCITMFSTMMQCIIIQMCALPLYESLQDRTPAKFQRVLRIAFGILFLIFSMFAFLGYSTAGPLAKSNAMLDLDKTIANDVAQIGVILMVIAVYPIMVIPMLAPLRHTDLTWFGVLRVGEEVAMKRRRRVVITTTVGIVFLSYLGALMFDTLGFVNVVDGSLCVGIFVGLQPALVGIYLLSRSSTSWRLLMVGLLLLGLGMAVIGFFFTDNLHEKLDGTCMLPTPATKQLVF